MNSSIMLPTLPKTVSVFFDRWGSVYPQGHTMLWGLDEKNVQRLLQ